MEKIEKHRQRFGLVGKKISYSFSKGYFSKKFEDLGLEHCSYENFDLNEIDQIHEVFEQDEIMGLNVTIPYKEKIIPYLKGLDETAKKIGAVNTIKLTKNGPIGFNTDAHGFKESLVAQLRPFHQKALILGTGGAAKAVAFVLDELNITHKSVSRKPKAGQFTYADLTPKTIEEYPLIINTTPLGTHPNVTDYPDIPYQFLTTRHFLFDLIYNPEKTHFLHYGEKQGAVIQNGLPMLKNQAEKAWEIWQNVN